MAARISEQLKADYSSPQMQKLKNQVFPAIPLSNVPTRKVLPKLTELRETDPNTIVMELSPWTWAAYEERAHGDPNPHPSVV